MDSNNTRTIDDLTSKQIDKNGQSKYAVFLPALSTFYGSFVGKQRYSNSVDLSRVPAGFENGIEGMNWLNPQKGYFPYKWSLYSAGHATLDINKHDPREDMVRNRDPNSFLLGDSGGYQIGKGVWEGDWKDPNCPKAMKKRTQVLSWMDAFMDRGMVLDIPTWLPLIPGSSKATGIWSYQDAIQATHINNDYFMKNRSGKCKFLNVLQGGTHSEADDWYAQVKKFCDPKQYSQPFEGWSMGGQNMCDIHLVLRRLIALRFDGLLEKGQHDWMHFLGTSRLEWALMLTDIQKAVRKYHNENFTISFDCASPFLATANGQIYFNVLTPDRGKWGYRMTGSVDNKKYATDNRSLRTALLQDKIFEDFIESPISERLKISDVCVYKKGDLNKIGKEGKTSWDSFSYALQMSHNVWTHIYSVQEANRQYDKGMMPDTLLSTNVNKKTFRQYDREFFKDVVNDIFATSDRAKAESIIEQYHAYWTSFNARSVNSLTTFNTFFTVEEPTPSPASTDDGDLDESKLEQLETNEE